VLGEGDDVSYETVELVTAVIGFFFIGGLVGIKVGYAAGYNFGFKEGQLS